MKKNLSIKLAMLCLMATISGFVVAAPSNNNAGMSYYYHGVPVSYQKLMQLVKQDDSEAEYVLADAYVSGDVPDSTTDEGSDNKKALYWYKKAADHGHPQALNAIAASYQIGELGVEQNDKLAYEWSLKAVEKGSSAACGSIADFYATGNSAVKKNLKLAEEWRKKCEIMAKQEEANQIKSEKEAKQRLKK